MLDPALAEWLLDSDPALRWQVERDLLGRPAEVWQATRARVATEGFGARLLALQDPDGQWAGGAFFPRGFTGAEREREGQPWTATTWTLNTLREWGLDAAALAGTAEQLAANSRWEYEDLPYWGGEVDCCINAWTLMNGLWLGADVEGIATWFVEHRLADGGWNCEWVEGSTRSSFHSTLNALKGLLAHEMATGGTAATREARRSGTEYLLERRLMRRRSTGEQVADWVTRFGYADPLALQRAQCRRPFPGCVAVRRQRRRIPGWRTRSRSIRAQRQPDGTWIQEGRDPGSRVVRGGRAGGRAVQVADVQRDARARLVGCGAVASEPARPLSGLVGPDAGVAGSGWPDVSQVGACA